MKETKRKAVSDKRTFQSEIKKNERKHQRIKKKKDKLYRNNDKLNVANTKLKKSIVERNETIKIIKEENNELSFQIELRLTDAENNEAIVQR